MPARKPSWRAAPERLKSWPAFLGILQQLLAGSDDLTDASKLTAVDTSHPKGSGFGGEVMLVP
jgi:hypothetical protein